MLRDFAIRESGDLECHLLIVFHRKNCVWYTSEFVSVILTVASSFAYNSVLIAITITAVLFPAFEYWVNSTEAY